MDLVLRDAAVARMWVLDIMTRKATRCLLRCLVRQLEHAVPNPLLRGWLPSGVRVHPLGPHETVKVLSTGTMIVLNTNTGVACLVFPSDFDVRQCLIIHHTTDRGSVGAALLHFAQHSKLLWLMSWGVFHDTWNSIKNAAKNCLAGKWWKTIVKFASIANLNHGPFRSGAWGRAKQEAHAHYCSSLSVSDDAFRAAARRQAALDGLPCDTDDDWAYWLQRISCLPSCVEAGPALKLARWMSIQQCWTYYRREIWLLREVLLCMQPDEGAREIERDTTSMLDAELVMGMATAKGGLLARAPSYITDELCDIMDMFQVATKAARAFYTERVQHVKSPDDGLVHLLGMVGGAWEDEMLAMIVDCCYDPANLNSYGALGGGARAHVSGAQMMAFVLQFLTERALRLMPTHLSYPYCTAMLLASDEARALAARADCVRDFDILLDAEKRVSRGDSRFAGVLDEVCWRHNSVVRLLLHVLRRDANFESLGEDARYLAKAIHMRIPDEKAVEDLHQHVRDRQRSRRHKNINMHSVFDAVITSGVLEARRVKSVQIDTRALASSAWRSIRMREKARSVSYQTPPLHWPRQLNDVLNPKKTWPSPTVPGQAKSLIAWKLLQHLFEENLHLDPWDAWWSRLVPQHSLVRSNTDPEKLYVCLFAGTWGCIVAKVDEVGDGIFKLANVRGSLQVVHLFSHDWVVVPVAGTVHDGSLVLRYDGAPQSLLDSALKARRDFSAWEARMCLAALNGQPRPTAFRVEGSAHELIGQLVEAVSAGRDGFVETILALYAKPPKEVEGLEADEELGELLEEMATTDQVNTGDLKAYKDDLAKKVVAKLHRARTWERKQAALQKKARAARKVRTQPRKRRGAALLRAVRRRRPADVEEPREAAPAVDGDVLPGAAPALPAPPPMLPVDAVDPPPRVAPPLAVGDWRVVAVRGGWLRYNATLGRLDAHCAAHAGCKMDRALRKGLVGLLCAWLAAAADAPHRAAHSDMKWTLSQREALPQRLQGRNDFVQLRVEHAGAYGAILDQELALRESADEPASIPCHWAAP